MTRSKLMPPCSRFRLVAKQLWTLVPGQAMDLTLYRNQTELGVSVFPVPLQMFDHCDRFFHQMIQMLGQVWRKNFLFKIVKFGFPSRNEPMQLCGNLSKLLQFRRAKTFFASLCVFSSTSSLFNFN